MPSYCECITLSLEKPFIAPGTPVFFSALPLVIILHRL
ncbi:putative membrane protein [Clostridioides difficile 6041]|nr:putative membrane protein [Clostridioides difficile 6041]